MRRRPRLTWPRALLVAAIVLCGALAVLWFVPSGQYLLLPDKARPVEPLVSIDNETGRTGANGGGIYMVDILVRRANLLERIFPGLNDGATLVPGQVFNPVGVSEQQRQQSSSLDMTRSQQIAAAVALESLGYARRCDAERGRDLARRAGLALLRQARAGRRDRRSGRIAREDARRPAGRDGGRETR